MESNRLQICLNSSVGNEMMKLFGNRGAIDLLCIFCCSDKAMRFNQINTTLKHISTKTLTSRLKEFEDYGILKRTAFNEIPPRVEYSITEKGQKLTNSIIPLLTWIAEYSESSKNAVCGCLTE